MRKNIFPCLFSVHITISLHVMNKFSVTRLDKTEKYVPQKVSVGNYMLKISPLMPGGNKKVTHT